MAGQAHPDSPLVPELPSPLLSLLAFGFHAWWEVLDLCNQGYLAYGHHIGLSVATRLLLFDVYS